MKKHDLIILLVLFFSFSAHAQWAPAGAGNIRNTNPGNVGIGTSSPGSKLDVEGRVEIGTGDMRINSTAIDNFVLATRSNGPNPNFRLEIGNNTGGSTHQPIFWNNMLILNGNGNSWCPTCGTSVDAAHRADMVIGATGNIGLGTVTPSTKLDVVGGVKFGSLGLNNALTRIVVSDINGVLSYRDASSLIGVGSGWTGAGTGNLYTTASSDNVGIGTSTPNAKLDVEGAIEVGTGGMKINSTAGDNFVISTKTNTPNPNFSIQVGNGAGGSSNQPIFWNNMLILNGSGNSWCPSCGTSVDATHRADVVVSSTGNVGMGTVTPGAKLDVKGNVIVGNVTIPSGYKMAVESGIITEKVRVAVNGTANWADYVFDEKYKLTKLSDLEQYIKQNKHLPDVPSAEEVVKGGIDLGKMDATLLQKVEELTLYVLQLNKTMEGIAKENKTLMEKNNALQNQLNEITK